jgi:ubiquinone/menaquinone biosynthesis C-methylase UbiE
MWADPRYRAFSPGERVIRYVLLNLGVKPGESIIDYGCGPGRTFATMREFGLDVRAVDIAENCLDPGIEAPLTVAPLWELPDTLGMSDWCFCCDVLEHMPEDRIDDVLAGIARRTLRGGFLQPALEADSFGPKVIGEPLHLTVKPGPWWLEKVGRHFSRVEGVEGKRVGLLRQIAIMVWK